MMYMVNHYFADNEPRRFELASHYLDELRARTGIDGSIVPIPESVTSSLSKRESYQDFYQRMLSVQNEVR